MSVAIKRIVLGIFITTMAILAMQLVLLVLTYSSTTVNSFGYRGAETTAGFVFTVVGVLIVLKQPRNLVGWMVFLSGVAHSFVGLAEEYAAYALLANPGSWPGGVTAAWIVDWLWVPPVGFGVILAFLRFPDGRLLSPGWKPVQNLTIVATIFVTLAWAFVLVEFDVFAPLENPYRIPMPEALADAIIALSLLTFASCMVLCIVSLVLRFRRSTGDQRQQLKWVLFAQAVAVTLISVVWLAWIVAGTFPPVLATLAVLGIFSIPVAIGIAMLRYGLYEIDVVINRTLVYVPLSALLAGVYVGGVGVLRTVFADSFGLSNDASVAVMAITMVALATPVRNKLQVVVDRHFKETVNPVKAIDHFATELDRVVEVFDRDRVARRFLDETVRALGAVSGRVVLFEGGEERTVHVDGEEDGAVALRMPIESDGQVLGELVLGRRLSSRPYTSAECASLEKAAAQVARAIGLSRQGDGAPMVRCRR